MTRDPARAVYTVVGPTFLVMGQVDYEGSGIISSHGRFEQAVADVEARSGPDNHYEDGFVVRVVFPGCGPGIEVARWRRHSESIYEAEGPPEADGTPPDDVYVGDRTTWVRIL